jgi:hypothetical protein
VLYICLYVKWKRIELYYISWLVTVCLADRLTEAHLAAADSSTVLSPAVPLYP